jgi:hypothetical protein
MPATDEGCDTPRCGDPGVLYAAGRRCGRHKPRGGSLTAAPRAPEPDRPELCPTCRSAALPAGRRVCQGCGAAALFWASQPW